MLPFESQLFSRFSSYPRYKAHSKKHPVSQPGTDPLSRSCLERVGLKKLNTDLSDVFRQRLFKSWPEALPFPGRRVSNKFFSIQDQGCTESCWVGSRLPQRLGYRSSLHGCTNNCWVGSRLLVRMQSQADYSTFANLGLLPKQSTLWPDIICNETLVPTG